MGRRMTAAARAARAIILATLVTGCANPLLDVVKDTARSGATASLSTLSLTGAGGAEIPLSPAFSSDICSYRAIVNRAVGTIAVHMDLADPNATWKVNDSPAVAGGVAVPLVVGENVLTIGVTSPSGLVEKTYTISVARGSIRALAGGVGFYQVLKSDGTLWAWGTNYYGQLGDGTTVDRTAPVRVGGIIDVVEVSSSNEHTLALKSDGTVWTWGNGGSSRLGREGDSWSPAQVTGLTGIVAVCAGSFHSLALRNDGTLWAWGTNWHGELGDSNLVDHPAPGQVTGLSGVVAIAAGESFTLALKGDGTVWAAGGNWRGQLGDGTGIDQTAPVAVRDLTGVKAIAAGQSHAAALKTDGTVWTWGYNSSWGGWACGQLGNGTAVNALSPVQVVGLADVVSISAAAGHTMALKSDGTVWAWGENSLGQLADQAARSRLTPIAVHLPAVALLATAANGTLASTTDDSVYFWGDNWDLSARSVKTAVHVAGITNAVSIAAGGMHSIAVKGDGTVWTWGDAFWGQLGNVISTNMTSPQQVTALSGVSAVGAGWVYSVALKSDGTIVWTWGDNVFGQLGDGTGVNSSTPVPVSGLSGVAAVQFGGHHGLALKSDHTIWAWGGNWSGQLGDGTTGNRWTPVAVSGPPAVAGTKIAAGENHSLAVVSGAAWAWGSNGRGQIGHGTPDGAPHAPVQVSGLTGVVTAVAGGCVHSIALKGDGTVWAWGGNDRGQLGNGSFTDSATPVAVSGLSGITAIAAGYYSSLALRSDGTVWAWGENKYGQLGNGGSADRNTPVPVTGLSGITAIAAGNGSHCLAIKSDGTVWAWGDGELGQAGGGLISLALTPVEVTLP